MQSESEGEHIDINKENGCEEKDAVLPDEHNWQKKNSYYRNSPRYFMILKVQRINVRS